MTLTMRGAFTALITPMKDNGNVDYDGFRALLRFQLEQGINGLVPLGTTGETPALERDEYEALTRIAVEEVKGRVPLIVGTGSNSTRHTVETTRFARDAGVDAALVVTPYYSKPNDAGLIRHFETVAGETGLPIVIYNIASRAGRNISASLMDRLSRIPGLIGVKESSGDVSQMGDMIHLVAEKRRAEGKPFAVLCGDDSFALPCLALGGDGLVSVAANLFPARVVALVDAALGGRIGEARALHYELLPLMKALFIETNPIPVKAAMGMAGFPAGEARLPLGPLSAENEARLRQVLGQYCLPV